MSVNNNKRIAKNTVYLYIRMIFLMFISLFTVRVTLKNLGVEDYGIFNLIAGIVVLFNFIANSSSAATSRFLNFALGENDQIKARKVYSSSVVIHLLVGLIILILSETIGLYLVNNYLVIPEERLFAANVIFQFSVVTTILGIINIPNNASIISHEKMSFYAFVSIFEGVMKLVIAFLISVFNGDKLIFYVFLISCVSFINFLINVIYVKSKFSICKFLLHKDKTIYKELFSFSGWSLLSSVGTTLSNQVLNMILNRFFGVLANAAIGVANQVNNTVYQFISNFQVAFEPQIVKSYAANEKDYLHELIFRTSKFSFYLLWIIVLPLSLNLDFVLTIWLSEVPNMATIFLRIILVYSLLDAIIGPLWMVSYAIGNIRNYQIVAFGVSFLTVPLAYIGFTFGFPPYWIVILRVLANFTFSAWRLGYLKKRMNFPVLEYLKNVLFSCLLVVALSSIFSFVVFHLTKINTILQFFASCVATVISNIFAIYFLGCNKSEKEFLVKIIKKFLRKA